MRPGIVSPFVLTAPLSLVAAGALLTIEGSEALRSSWDAATLSLTHVGALGFLTLSMFGLVYEVAPAIASRRVRGPRLAYAVLALLVLGIASLAWSLRSDARWAVLASLSALSPGLLLFIAPLAWSLRGERTPTVGTALLLALAGLLLAGVLGLWMLHGHGGMQFPGPRGLWVQVHLSVALLGWVGGLQAGLVWHLVPGARPRRAPDRLANLRLALLGVGIVLPVLVLGLAMVGILGAGLASTSRLAALGALPAAISVWVLQPLQMLRSLARSERENGAGLLLVKSSLALAPLTGLAALAAYVADGDRWGLLLGWVAIWGWAGMLAHGLLLRVAAPRPATASGLGFGLHLASLIAGVFAILIGLPWIARGAGLLLVATALELGRCHVSRLRARPV
ncbi:MAG: hypothetical protein V3V67_06270 [Myxococcota bacterium]